MYVTYYTTAIRARKPDNIICATGWVISFIFIGKSK